MRFIQDLFGSVQDVAQNTIPDPQELMDTALQSTQLNDTVQQFIESPQDIFGK